MIQVLVVDDHPLMLEMLCMVVDDETDLQVAGRAANGMEAVQKYQALQPQVVVMEQMEQTLYWGHWLMDQQVQ